MKTISLLIVILVLCSTLVAAAQLYQEESKISETMIGTIPFPTPFPFPQGYWIGLGMQTSPGAREQIMVKVPEKLQEPIRLQAQITKAVLQAPGEEVSEAPGPTPTAEEPASAPAPTPKVPTPKTPPPTKTTGDGELGPPWTVEKCDKYLGGRCFEGYADLPDSCDCAGPVTPIQNCALCNPNSQRGPSVCVDQNGKIIADARCVSGGVAISIANQNNGATYSVTSEPDGSFELDTSTTANPAKPGDILSMTLA
jgi:hypothetical protein